MTAQIEHLLVVIAKWPGKTEKELATILHGRGGYQQQVNQDCRMLVDSKKVERRGLGGPGSPYTYYARARTKST